MLMIKVPFYDRIWHDDWQAYPVTGSVATAAAALLEGSIVYTAVPAEFFLSGEHWVLRHGGLGGEAVQNRLVKPTCIRGAYSRMKPQFRLN